VNALRPSSVLRRRLEAAGKPPRDHARVIDAQREPWDEREAGEGSEVGQVLVLRRLLDDRRALGSRRRLGRRLDRRMARALLTRSGRGVAGRAAIFIARAGWVGGA